MPVGFKVRWCHCGRMRGGGEGGQARLHEGDECMCTCAHWCNRAVVGWVKVGK